VASSDRQWPGDGYHVFNMPSLPDGERIAILGATAAKLLRI
jgi:hypothetical protein